jgi:hypothetical protein
LLLSNIKQEKLHDKRSLCLFERKILISFLKFRIQSENKGQLQPYKTYEANYEDFIQTIDRKNDTLYFVSFKRDHLIFPATAQNQTQRPKMSLILPASMANLNSMFLVLLKNSNLSIYFRIYSCPNQSCPNVKNWLWSRRYKTCFC